MNLDPAVSGNDKTVISCVDLELLSVSCAIADRFRDWRKAHFSRPPVFLHVSMPFLARYGMLTQIMGLGVQVDPQLKGLAFYLRKEK